MSYWNNHPELYDEIIVKELVRRGIVTTEAAEETEAWELVNQHKDRKDFHIITTDAEADYWSGLADNIKDRMEDEKIGRSKA